LKPKELSLLVIHRDKATRQLLATYLCETYECVTAAAPEEVERLLAQKSFDLMLTPKVVADPSEEKEGARTPRTPPAVAAVIRSSATGNQYELRLINHAASYLPNPFELVLLRALIAHAELGFKILSIENGPGT
jgi:DNA-binding response OmpR family regulator